MNPLMNQSPSECESSTNTQSILDAHPVVIDSPSTPSFLEGAQDPLLTTYTTLPIHALYVQIPSGPPFLYCTLTLVACCQKLMNPDYFVTFTALIAFVLLSRGSALTFLILKLKSRVTIL